MSPVQPKQAADQANRPWSNQRSLVFASVAILGVLILAVFRSGALAGSQAPGSEREASPAVNGPAVLDGLYSFGSVTRGNEGTAGGSAASATLAEKSSDKPKTPAEAGNAAAQSAQNNALAQQQAAMEAELKAKQDALDRAAAEQAQKESDLAAQQKALAAEQNSAREQEMERIRKAEADAAAAAAAAAAAKAPKLYSGPSSGSLVWEGAVAGDTLISISGGTSDTGQVISGALPGVNVLLTLSDTKHFRIASAPAPSNGFKRIVLGASGKGTMRITLHWSIP